MRILWNVMRIQYPIFNTIHRMSLILIGIATMPFSAFAQETFSIIPEKWRNSSVCNIKTGDIKAGCIPELIGHLISVVFGLISAFFILNVIYAGYQIALGSWNGEKAEGKDRLLWSMIGVVISTCAFLILDLVISIITP